MAPTATDNCSEVVTMELVSDVTTQDIIVRTDILEYAPGTLPTIAAM